MTKAILDLITERIQQTRIAQFNAEKAALRAEGALLILEDLRREVQASEEVIHDGGTDDTRE